MPTDRGCARIETVLDELFSNGAQVNDDLAGLYLMDLQGSGKKEFGNHEEIKTRTERASMAWIVAMIYAMVSGEMKRVALYALNVGAKLRRNYSTPKYKLWLIPTSTIKYC